jgi:hypothetical protein
MALIIASSGSDDAVAFAAIIGFVSLVLTIMFLVWFIMTLSSIRKDMSAMLDGWKSWKPDHFSEKEEDRGAVHEDCEVDNKLLDGRDQRRLEKGRQRRT